MGHSITDSRCIIWCFWCDLVQIPPEIFFFLYERGKKSQKSHFYKSHFSEIELERRTDRHPFTSYRAAKTHLRLLQHLVGGISSWWLTFYSTPLKYHFSCGSSNLHHGRGGGCGEERARAWSVARRHAVCGQDCAWRRTLFLRLTHRQISAGYRPGRGEWVWGELMIVSKLQW